MQIYADPRTALTMTTPLDDRCRFIATELLHSFGIPALGPFGLTLLGVGIAAVAFGLLRTRAGVAWAMVLALLAGLGAAGVAYAATIIMDGQVADWAGITALGTDPTGDSSIGDPAEDIVAGFATFDASNVYFRVDVRNVSCTPTSVSAPTITPGGPTTFCAGGSVVLTASAGFSSYLWSTGATTQAITVLTAGTYTVQGTNASGCQSPASAGTTVTVTPNVGGSISANPTTVSFGSNSALTINVTNGTSWSLSSSLGNHFGTSGGSGSGTFSSVYSADNNTGTDTVTLTIIGPCGSPTTRTVTITVN